MAEIDREEEHELTYTIRITSYGHKDKCVRNVGMTVAKALYLAFGDRFTMTDHKDRPIRFDPDAHDWGFGEN